MDEPTADQQRRLRKYRTIRERTRRNLAAPPPPTHDSWAKLGIARADGRADAFPGPEGAAAILGPFWFDGGMGGPLVSPMMPQSGGAFTLRFGASGLYPDPSDAPPAETPEIISPWALTDRLLATAGADVPALLHEALGTLPAHGRILEYFVQANADAPERRVVLIVTPDGATGIYVDGERVAALDADTDPLRRDGKVFGPLACWDRHPDGARHPDQDGPWQIWPGDGGATGARP